MATEMVQPGVSGEALEELQTQLRGPAFDSSDPAAAGVRSVFNAMHDGQPHLVIQCTGTADVVDAVKFARANGLPVTVRGGGHSIAGLSAREGGVLIDLAAMNGVQVDPDNKRAYVQGGALWGDVDRETQLYGLVAPGGVVSDTGVAGLALGGGYGWVRRKYGLSCDSIVEAQVVTADGEVLTASEDENSDLYWAIRGGSGNFGIVTSFTFELHELGPEVAFSATFYPIEEYAQILRGFREFTGKAPDEVTSVCVTVTFPADPHMPEAVHDRPVVIVGGVYAGDVDKGMKETEPLRGLGTPLFDMSGPTPFSVVQTGFDGLFPRGEIRAYWKSQYLEELSDGAIEVIHAKAQERPAPLTLVNVFHMGGKIADVDPEDTAFATRSAPYMVSIDGMWSDPADDADCIAWTRATWEAVREFGTGEVYLNFTGRADEAPSEGVDSALGRNLARLAEVKAKYDPDNFFALNDNIAPAS